MRISYNIKGSARKSLVGAISQELSAPTKYLGAPTFSYEVGEYTIDKNGVLSSDDNPGLVADLQGLHDFKAITAEYDTPLAETEPIPEDVQIPYAAALGGRVSPYHDGEEPPSYEVTESDETDRLTIEMPRSTFSDASIENLKRLVESKSSLIKKALGAETLDIEILDDTIRFPWFTIDDAETVKAYTHFVTALCKMAKTQQRVNTVKKPVENEKYAFRCFLLRLNFIGSDYKTDRKILLSKLSGSSSFKSGTKSEVIENE